MHAHRPLLTNLFTMASNDVYHDDSSDISENYDSDSDSSVFQHDQEFVGYRFEPQRSESESVSSTSDSELDDEPVENPASWRLSSINWCTCTNCVVMNTDVESICCREMDNVHLKEKRDNVVVDCVCLHPKFTTLCLDRDVLGVAAITVSGMLLTDVPDPITDRFLRLTSYRQFTLWVHGKLGRHNRRPVPSCVVTRIRQEFPDLDGEDDFVGFLFP